MAFWPRDDRTVLNQFQSVGEKRRNYPYVQPGLTGAATLSPEDFKWTFLSRPLLPVGKDPLRFREHREIFPATRPPKLQTININRRADQGANFLRVYLPDIEVTSDLIHQHLSEDILQSRKFDAFDPYSGNLLDKFRNPVNSRLSSIIFPTGETNCHLNSCLIDISNRKITFTPRAEPVWRFATPIQHVVMSNNLDVNNLAIRTFGNLQLFTLQYTDSTDRLMVEAHSAFSRAEFDGEKVVDMTYSSVAPNLFTIGHKGSLFESCFCGPQSFNKLQQFNNIDSQETTSEFWKISMDKNFGNGFVLSLKEVMRFDTRTTSSNTVLRLADGRQLFTAVEDVQQDNLLRLCSTSDILWLDLRFPRKPLLAYAHGRDYDQYMSTTTVNYPGQGPVTVLTCRNNGLTTVYDMSYSTSGLFYLDQSPYELSSPSDLYCKHFGQQFLEHADGVGLFRLSERGSITYHEIQSRSSQMETEIFVRKSARIKKMEAAVPCLRGDKATQNYTQVDMYEGYSALFDERSIMKKQNDHSISSVEDLLQRFPHYIQNHELPLQHILTTYDVAFRSGNEPQCPGRPDFLTESILTSATAYDALQEGRFAQTQVKAPWHRSIASTLERLDENFRSDSQELMEYLKEFDLSGDNVSQYGRELEQVACKQLVLDLMLSSDIFSRTKFSGTEVGDSVENMTEALSLGGGLPLIKFGYLQPLRKSISHEKTSTHQLEISSAVRQLLKEWDVHDVPSRSEDPVDRGWQNVGLKPHGPPQILTSNIIGLKAQSQEYTSSVWFESESQKPNGLASTQVMPGPFGGRPTMKKNKRLGGF